MATLDLDPVFVKALRLLHSKARDSADQLKQLLNDSLHSSGQDSKDTVGSLKLSISYKKGSPKHSSPETASHKKSSSSLKEEHLKKKEVDKRAFEKLKQDLTELGQETVAKKPRLDPPKPVPAKAAPVIPPVTIKEEPSGSEDNTSATDIALEMGLACIVCRSFDVSSGNTLVECQDCHTLYHQECHRPPITEQDVNDPRLVWYCAKCTKNIKKLASKNQKTAKSTSSSAAPIKETITITKPVKTEPVAASAPPSSYIFKRVEPKVPSGSAPTSSVSASVPSSNKPIGLAGLAASLSGKLHPTAKPPHQSVAGGKPPLPSATKGSAVPLGGSSSASKTGSSSSTTNLKGSSYSTMLMAGKTSSSGSSGAAASALVQLGSGISTLSSKSTSSSTSSAAASKSSLSSGSGGNGGGGTGAGAGNGSSSSAAPGAGKASSSLMSADKRLQIMKKKAAAKMQEKRRLSSK